MIIRKINDSSIYRTHKYGFSYTNDLNSFYLLKEWFHSTFVIPVYINNNQHSLPRFYNANYTILPNIRIILWRIILLRMLSFFNSTTVFNRSIAFSQYNIWQIKCKPRYQTFPMIRHMLCSLPSSRNSCSTFLHAF